jgi:hypothetical protein
MKQVRKAIARLVAKAAPSAKLPALKTPPAIRPLGAEQLRQVAGGTDETQLPKGNW